MLIFSLSQSNCCHRPQFHCHFFSYRKYLMYKVLAFREKHIRGTSQVSPKFCSKTLKCVLLQGDSCAGVQYREEPLKIFFSKSSLSILEEQ